MLYYSLYWEMFCPSIVSSGFLLWEYLDFVKGLNCFFWCGRLIPVLEIICVISCAYWFIHVELSLHVWSEANLITVNYLFICSWIQFANIILLYLYFCSIFALFGNPDITGFVKRFGCIPFSSYSLQNNFKSVGIGYYLKA